MLTGITKRLADAQARRVKLEKVVADLTKPLVELEALRQQEAQAQAAQDAAQAEYAQLVAEMADVSVLIPRLDAMLRHEKLVLEALTAADDLCTGGYLGGAQSIGKTRVIFGLARDLHEVSTVRARAITARLNVLEG